MHAFDYAAQKRGLNKTAKDYPERAEVFRDINAMLIERLQLLKLAPTRILDLGAGTGQLSRELLKIYPKARVYCLDLAEERLKVAYGKRKWFRQQHYVCGDMHTLPFSGESFDLVISNLTWHWADHLHQAIYEAKRVLKLNGQLLFTSFGPDTLRELRASFAAASENPHVHSFLDMHDVGDALLKAGLADPVMDSEHLSHRVPTIKMLLTFIQSIGESNYMDLRSRTVLGKKRFAAMQEYYEQFREDGKLPVSLEVVFGYAWRKQELSSQLENGDIAVPLSVLKR